MSKAKRMRAKPDPPAQVVRAKPDPPAVSLKPGAGLEGRLLAILEGREPEEEPAGEEGAEETGGG